VLLATDLKHCPVEGEFGGADVEKALEGHVLDRAEVMGRYSLYPPLIKNR